MEDIIPKRNKNKEGGTYVQSVHSVLTLPSPYLSLSTPIALPFTYPQIFYDEEVNPVRRDRALTPSSLGN